MSPEDVYPSHKGYLYFQPNPLKNVIGDCVIRAYCAVFGQSWETTLDMLARSCEYKNTLLNGLTIYRSLTSEYEFDPRSRLTEAGEMLLERYAQYTAAVRESADALFHDYFRGVLE